MRKKVDMQTKNRIKMSAVILFVFLIFISYNVFFRNDEVLALSKYGSRGDEVRQIQTKLKRWGYYSGNVDGIYGSKTLAAVKWFQSKNGLTADGIAGKKTLEAMGIYTSSSIGCIIIFPSEFTNAYFLFWHTTIIL
mgnify:CR=1 FL=1